MPIHKRTRDEWLRLVAESQAVRKAGLPEGFDAPRFNMIIGGEMEPKKLEGKTHYTASVFKKVEADYGVNFVGKELYDKIGKGKPFGYELFMKKDSRSAMQWLKGQIDFPDSIIDKKHRKPLLLLIDEAFKDCVQD